MSTCSHIHIPVEKKHISSAELPTSKIVKLVRWAASLKAAVLYNCNYIICKKLFIKCIAFHRLTDEESRKNWEEYGNPDGPEGICLEMS